MNNMTNAKHDTGNWLLYHKNVIAAGLTKIIIWEYSSENWFHYYKNVIAAGLTKNKELSTWHWKLVSLLKKRNKCLVDKNY